MPRIRTIKPDAFTSESLARLDYFTRWTFAGLWTYFDDEGYGRGDCRLIKAALFALDDDVTVKKVEKAIESLTIEDCICRYQVASREFIHAPNWGSHQRVNRPTKTKFPRCPEHDNGENGEVLSTHGALSESTVSAHGRKGTGNREQGTSSAETDGAFDEFWKLYPRKVAKAEAQQAFTKALRSTEATAIMQGLRTHLPSWEHSEIKFIPHASTWINGQRWSDEADVEVDPYAYMKSTAQLRQEREAGA